MTKAIIKQYPYSVTRQHSYSTSLLLSLESDVYVLNVEVSSELDNFLYPHYVLRINANFHFNYPYDKPLILEWGYILLSQFV